METAIYWNDAVCEGIHLYTGMLCTSFASAWRNRAICRVKNSALRLSEISRDVMAKSTLNEWNVTSGKEWRSWKLLLKNIYIRKAFDLLLCSPPLLSLNMLNLFLVLSLSLLVSHALATARAQFCTDENGTANCGISYSMSNPGCFSVSSAARSIRYHVSGPFLEDKDYTLVYSPNSGCHCQNNKQTVRITGGPDQPVTTVTQLLTDKSWGSFRWISGDGSKNNCWVNGRWSSCTSWLSCEDIDVCNTRYYKAPLKEIRNNSIMTESLIYSSYWSYIVTRKMSNLIFTITFY